jgi:hypothetical protein
LTPEIRPRWAEIDTPVFREVFMFHLSIRMLLAAASVTTSAWAADPADPAAPTRPLDHRSVFDTYRAGSTGAVGDWREANDAVGRQAGGHAHDHGSTAAAPPDPHAGHDHGAQAATDPHAGHHGHMHDHMHDGDSSAGRGGHGHHTHDHGGAVAASPEPHVGHDHGAPAAADAHAGHGASTPAGGAAKHDHGAAGGEAKPHHCPHHAAHHASMHSRMHDAHPSGQQHGGDSGAMKSGHGHRCHHDSKEGGDAHKH